jgi:hypothetical protein
MLSSCAAAAIMEAEQQNASTAVTPPPPPHTLSVCVCIDLKDAHYLFLLVISRTNTSKRRSHGVECFEFISPRASSFCAPKGIN